MVRIMQHHVPVMSLQQGFLFQGDVTLERVNTHV